MGEEIPLNDVHLEIVNANLIRHQFDLSKRQNSVISFIWTFSLGIGKRKALIPLLQDFKNCGVSATKIKGELEKLSQMNIIKVNETEHLYEINLNIDEWRDVPINRNWNGNRTKELLELNSKHKEWV